jgi:hypothetical protein
MPAKEPKKYQANYYQRNKEAFQKRLLERRHNTAKWLAEYKSKLKCLYCQEKHVACLQFHHRDQSQKDINISYAVSQGWSRERILREIAKCDVVCANCHAKIHYNEKHTRFD